MENLAKLLGDILLIEANELIRLYKDKKWRKNIVILDASWYLPTVKREPFNEFKNTHLPDALYFDIDEVSDTSSNLPHTIPTIKQFEFNMEKLGINNYSHIILYSMDGIGTSPRAWWLFKLFKHKNISVLNGGMKAWKSINGPVNNTISKINKTSYKADLDQSILIKYDDLKNFYNNKNYQVVDARSHARFVGVEDEPRPGLQKGHIPNSINIPFNLLINDQGYLINKNKIIEVLNKYNFNYEKIIISTCGSGVTACVLAFALDFIGKKSWKVYDGSWSEWGQKGNKLIEV